MPRRAPWPVGVAVRSRWRRAFRGADACVFTSRALALRWCEFGLPDDLPILEIPEASTVLRPIERAAASKATGLTGAPQVLWAGRLDRNKDPETILDGFELALRTLPRAQLTMVAPLGGLRTEMQRHIDSSPALCGRVALAGPLPHRDMPAYYSAADVFVSGSHHEGSGFALIEAMACGAVPCVTDIPAFRALTGSCGARWPPGDPRAFANALVQVAGNDLAVARSAVRLHFETALSWDVIGRALHAAYEGLLERHRGSS
jgi:glycosyltransferase involved in cell wall biosynthesis